MLFGSVTLRTPETICVMFKNSLVTGGVTLAAPVPGLPGATTPELVGEQAHTAP